MARAMEWWCYRPGRVRRLVAVSPAIKDELVLAFPGLAAAVTVIPNGVDLKHFRPDAATRVATRESLGIPGGSRAAVFVGGDWERKGLEVALHALARTPEWILVVVGPGDRRRYEAIADSAGVADRVIFAGPQADTWPFFAAADAFALPTCYEGFALVTLEAAATGLPLLLTAAAGADALVVSGVNGWLLDRTAEAFATGLAQLTDAAVAKRMGEEARAAAGKFGWSEIGDAHASVYSTLRNETGRHPPPVGTSAATS
jgi:UDP-glucose:(heptosyl)LPS alpha-1,3-glucosyltransferase